MLYSKLCSHKKILVITENYCVILKYFSKSILLYSNLDLIIPVD